MGESVEEWIAHIRGDFGCDVVMAAEQECCLRLPVASHEAIMASLLEQAKEQGHHIDSIAKEVGANAEWQQYEIRLGHASPLHTVQCLAFIRDTLPTIAGQNNSECTFVSFIENNEITSSLQIHLHLLNEDGEYLFMKQEDQLSEALQATLGGLLHMLETSSMPIFAANDAAVSRLRSSADHVPVAACWGGNNRSVALRLPESVVPHRHIEHRVPGSDADPQEVIAAILQGVHYGLKRQPDPGPQFHGDARRSNELKRLVDLLS